MFGKGRGNPLWRDVDYLLQEIRSMGLAEKKIKIRKVLPVFFGIEAVIVRKDETSFETW